jgi:hypothetical protein
MFMITNKFMAVVLLAFSLTPSLEAKESFIDKPFMDFTEAEEFCRCISSLTSTGLRDSSTRGGEIPYNVDLNFIRSFFKNNPSSKPKPRCLDANQNNRLDLSEQRSLEKLFAKLKSPVRGISCGAVVDISSKIKASPQSYTCRASGALAATLSEHSSYVDQEVLAGSLSVTGALATGNIFVANGGSGFIEFRKLSLIETPMDYYGGGVLNFSSLEQQFTVVSNVLDKYSPVTSFRAPQSPSPAITAISDWSFKKCGTPNLDPGHLARAYCELSGLNGIVFAESSLSEQRVSHHFGSSYLCVN